MKTTIATTYEAEKNACNYTGEDLSFETELSPTEITEFSTEKSLLKLDVGKLSPISGVGDEAAGNNNGITFRVGKVMMYIQSEPGTTRTTQAEMIAAAKVMISHLG